MKHRYPISTFDYTCVPSSLLLSQPVLITWFLINNSLRCLSFLGATGIGIPSLTAAGRLYTRFRYLYSTLILLWLKIINITLLDAILLYLLNLVLIVTLRRILLVKTLNLNLFKVLISSTMSNPLLMGSTLRSISKLCFHLDFILKYVSLFIKK